MDEATISVEEREAVFARLRRYLWCMDTGNIAGVPDNFTSDATIRDVTGKSWDTQTGGVRGFANHFLGPSNRPASQHWLQPMSIQDTGDGKLLVISYWTALATDPGTNERYVRHIGSYRDTMIKVNGTWLIAEKIIDPWNAETMAKLGPLV